MGIGESTALSPISSSIFLMSMERSAILRAVMEVSSVVLHEGGGALTDGDRGTVIADKGDSLLNFVGGRHFGYCRDGVLEKVKVPCCGGFGCGGRRVLLEVADKLK
jgi:hypothetical protein